MDCTRFKHKAYIIPMIIGGLVIAGAIALLFGFVVMWLWNWLMPEIFGLPIISYWQAWGLVVLSHILFKSFPHSAHHHKYHNDEWKSSFREKYKNRCKPNDVIIETEAKTTE